LRTGSNTASSTAASSSSSRHRSALLGAFGCVRAAEAAAAAVFEGTAAAAVACSLHTVLQIPPCKQLQDKQSNYKS
jgi:hypothetical protein